MRDDTDYNTQPTAFWRCEQKSQIKNLSGACVFLGDERNDWSVHGHIVRVNEAQDGSQRRGLGDIPLEEEIVVANGGKPLIRRLKTLKVT